MSMPGYVEKALNRFAHSPPTTSTTRPTATDACAWAKALCYGSLEAKSPLIRGKLCQNVQKEPFKWPNNSV